MKSIDGNWRFSYGGPSHRNQCYALADGETGRAFLLWYVTAYYLMPVRRILKSEAIKSERHFLRCGVPVALSMMYETFRNYGKDYQINMAKKQSIAVSRWVNIPLGEDDKDAIAAADMSVEDIMLAIASMVYTGYRFSVTWDDYSSAIQVSLVCGDSTSPNYEMGMSARHPDFDMALFTLWYKHQILTGGNWAKFASEPRATNWG
jgi:hypothetical protein